MSQQYNQFYRGQIDTSTDGILQQSQQGFASVDDMDTETERSELQNGDVGEAPPVSNSEETTDTEVKNDQNGDVKPENCMEGDKEESNAQADGDLAPVPTNMEE